MTSSHTHLYDVRPTVSFFDDPRTAGAAAHLRNQSPGGSNSTAGADSGRGPSSEEGRETPTRRRQSRLVASPATTTTTTVTLDIRPNGLLLTLSRSIYVRLSADFSRCKRLQRLGDWLPHDVAYLQVAHGQTTGRCIVFPSALCGCH